YKKDIPLNVLNIIQPYMKRKSKHYVLVDPKSSMLLFKDQDERSKFFFEIKSFSYPQNIFHLAIEYSPRTVDSIEPVARNIRSSDLDKFFSQWLKYLAQYSEVSIYDDPILKQYHEEFFQEFQILDDGANTSSFDLQTQFWLDEYCDTMSLKLGEMETVENNKEITKIQEDIKELKDKQSSLTKNEVISRLSLIWAKSRKLGLNFLNEIFTKVRSSFSGKLKTLTIE
ncbi:MAG: hypothetical protein ORN53_02860, partial [Crocinitomicaceae bacterium]|nr:hypothetical protein [Crocinitomicaceae bacterium]